LAQALPVLEWVEPQSVLAMLWATIYQVHYATLQPQPVKLLQCLSGSLSQKH
jgi:hypothetical protein